MAALVPKLEEADTGSLDASDALRAIAAGPSGAQWVGASSKEGGLKQLEQASRPTAKAEDGVGVKREEHEAVLRQTTQQYLPTPSPAPDRMYDPGFVSAPTLPRDTSEAAPSLLTSEALRALAGEATNEERNHDSDADSLSSACTALADAAVLPSSRRTILYTAAENVSFATSSTFLADCSRRLTRQYGTVANTYCDYPLYFVARCARRKSHSCKFAVRAEKQASGRWRVNLDACHWEHSHPPEELAREGNGEGERSAARENPESAESSEEQVRPAGHVHRKAARKPRPPSPAGSWTATTRSSSMLRLVATRDKIFAKQRQLENHGRTSRSEGILAEYFSTLSATNTVSSGSLAKYEAFCEAQSIPPWPITPALVALSLFARCSEKDAYYLTYQQDLGRFSRFTHKVWETAPGYDKLVKWGGAEVAIQEFMEERAGLRVRGSKRTHVLVSESSSSEWSGADSDDAADTSDEEADGSEHEAAELGPATVIPNLPKPDDTFASVKALYLAYATALIPATGISVNLIHESDTAAGIQCNRSRIGRRNPFCPFALRIRRDSEIGRWHVDVPKSNLTHNHGAASQLLKNPLWRPTIRNADLREALGLLPTEHRGNGQPKSVTKKKDTGGEKTQGDGRKGKDKESQRVVDGGKKIKVKKPRTSVAAAENSSSAPPPIRQPSASFASPTLVSPNLSLAQIVAFLTSLHPSLPPLAPHLLAAGYNSVESIASLAQLAPEVLDALLDHLRTSSEDAKQCPPGAGRIGVIQAKLFAKEIKGVMS
ncbi:hypothetical protein JCM10213v2_002125 [Rhodosporidiobolus nylandii]